MSKPNHDSKKSLQTKYSTFGRQHHSVALEVVDDSDSITDLDYDNKRKISDDSTLSKGTHTVTNVPSKSCIKQKGATSIKSISTLDFKNTCTGFNKPALRRTGSQESGYGSIKSIKKRLYKHPNPFDDDNDMDIDENASIIQTDYNTFGLQKNMQSIRNNSYSSINNPSQVSIKRRSYYTKSVRDTDVGYNDGDEQPIKYSNLFSFAAEKVDMYDDFLDDLGEFCVEAVGMQENMQVVANERKELSDEIDTCLAMNGVPCKKGNYEPEDQVYRIKNLRETFLKIEDRIEEGIMARQMSLQKNKEKLQKKVQHNANELHRADNYIQARDSEITFLKSELESKICELTDAKLELEEMRDGFKIADKETSDLAENQKDEKTKRANENRRLSSTTDLLKNNVDNQSEENTNLKKKLELLTNSMTQLKHNFFVKKEILDNDNKLQNDQLNEIRDINLQLEKESNVLKSDLLKKTKLLQDEEDKYTTLCDDLVMLQEIHNSDKIRWQQQFEKLNQENAENRISNNRIMANPKPLFLHPLYNNQHESGMCIIESNTKYSSSGSIKDGLNIDDNVNEFTIGQDDIDDFKQTEMTDVGPNEEFHGHKMVRMETADDLSQFDGMSVRMLNIRKVDGVTPNKDPSQIKSSLRSIMDYYNDPRNTDEGNISKQQNKLNFQREPNFSQVNRLSDQYRSMNVNQSPSKTGYNSHSKLSPLEKIIARSNKQVIATGNAKDHSNMSQHVQIQSELTNQEITQLIQDLETNKLSKGVKQRGQGASTNNIATECIDQRATRLIEQEDHNLTKADWNRIVSNPFTEDIWLGTDIDMDQAPATIWSLHQEMNKLKAKYNMMCEYSKDLKTEHDILVEELENKILNYLDTIFKLEQNIGKMPPTARSQTLKNQNSGIESTKTNNSQDSCGSIKNHNEEYEDIILDQTAEAMIEIENKMMERIGKKGGQLIKEILPSELPRKNDDDSENEPFDDVKSYRSILSLRSKSSYQVSRKASSRKANQSVDKGGICMKKLQKRLKHTKDIKDGTEIKILMECIEDLEHTIPYKIDNKFVLGDVIIGKFSDKPDSIAKKEIEMKINSDNPGGQRMMNKMIANYKTKLTALDRKYNTLEKFYKEGNHNNQEILKTYDDKQMTNAHMINEQNATCNLEKFKVKQWRDMADRLANKYKDKESINKIKDLPENGILMSPEKAQNKSGLSLLMMNALKNTKKETPTVIKGNKGIYINGNNDESETNAGIKRPPGNLSRSRLTSNSKKVQKKL